MSNRRFTGLRSQEVEVNVPDAAVSNPQPPRNRRINNRFIGAISVFLILCLLLSAGAGVIYWYTQQDNAQATNAQPGSPTQSSSGQTNGGTVATPFPPSGVRQTLTICFASFGSYFPAILVPALNNPTYQAVLYPFQFADPTSPDILITKGTEPEQTSMMQSGECDIVLNTIDVLAKNPSMGQWIAHIDQSAGADKTVAWNVGLTPGCAGKNINIFNDLRGCVIAAAGDSVSEFQALSFVQVSGNTVNDITIDTHYETAGDAVQAFLDGDADAVSGWVPDVDDAITPDSKVLVNSTYLRTIYDSIIVSKIANEQKKEAVVAFLGDWFTAVKMVAQDPAGSSKAIADWQYNGMATNDWTYVFPETSQDDMAAWLETIAQAGFDHNQIYVAHPELVKTTLSYDRNVWEYGGGQLGNPFSVDALVNTTYLTALANRSDLRPAAGTIFINNTFSPFPPDQANAPTVDQLIKLPTVAEFGCPGFSFQPGDTALDTSSGDYSTFIECTKRLLQLMSQADVQILITGSAAHPDPTIFGAKYTPEYCLNVALKRAVSVQSALLGLGFPGNRIAINTVIGPMRQNADEMPQDRWVKIEIKASADSLR